MHAEITALPDFLDPDVARYTADDHSVWALLYERRMETLEGRGRRRLVSHARSQTVERRAYGRPARGLPSWDCIAGYSDATSV